MGIEIQEPDSQYKLLPCRCGCWEQKAEDKQVVLDEHAT